MTPSNAKRTQADSDLRNREIFQCLADRETPKSALGASIGAHAVVLMVLLLVPLVTPQTLNLNYRSVMLAPPPEPPKISEPLILKLVRPTPPPKPTLPRKEAIVEPPPPLPMPKPVVRPPEVRIAEVVPPPAMAPSIAPSIVDPKPVPTAPPPQLSVLTNVFSNATSSAVTAAPTRNTEVAGFGDTTGSRAVGRTGKVEATGAGFGDVNKGSSDRGRSAAARVGSVGGFDAQAPAAVRKDNDRGVPVAAGFAAPSEAPKSSASGPPKVLEPKNEKPVEIVLKPRPDYTDEARKMRVEGEVLLRVLFASSGEVRVLEVVRGLGHGLNENAIRAAEQIRFKPAQRAGNPVDSTAIVHILFQLAY